MKHTKQSALEATSAYAMLQIVCWGFFAINMGFSSNVLYELGFTGGQVSILLGLCTAVSFLLQLCLAEWITASGKIRLYAMLAGLGLVMMGANALVLIPQLPRWGAAVSYGVCCLLLLMMPSFINAIGMDAIKRGSAANYSAARAVGSLGYSILAYVTGLLVRSRGVEMVAVMGILNAAMLVVSSLWFHRAGERGLPVQTVTPGKAEGSPGFLRAYPLFALFLGASVLLQFSHNLLSAFLFQIMADKNGGADQQGVAAAISALVELPVMFFFPLMMRRLRCDKWVRFSSLFVAVKCVGILLSTSPQGIYWAQATQMLGYGLYTISSVNYAEMVVGRGESVRAQTYLGATCTVGTLLATSTGGFLCQHLGPQVMVLVSLAAALTGGAVIAFTDEKTRE